jgi:hypothetical protein
LKALQNAPVGQAGDGEVKRISAAYQLEPLCRPSELLQCCGHVLVLHQWRLRLLNRLPDLVQFVRDVGTLE